MERIRQWSTNLNSVKNGSFMSHMVYWKGTIEVLRIGNGIQELKTFFFNIFLISTASRTLMGLLFMINLSLFLFLGCRRRGMPLWAVCNEMGIPYQKKILPLERFYLLRSLLHDFIQWVPMQEQIIHKLFHDNHITKKKKGIARPKRQNKNLESICLQNKIINNNPITPLQTISKKLSDYILTQLNSRLTLFKN